MVSKLITLVMKVCHIASIQIKVLFFLFLQPSPTNLTGETENKDASRIENENTNFQNLSSTEREGRVPESKDWAIVFNMGLFNLVPAHMS